MARTNKVRAVSPIALGGLVAGVLDISDALIFNGARGMTPLRLLQYIAAAVLGKGSYQGGWRTAALGLALHFLIAFTAAAVYWFASRRIAFMRDRPVPAGLLYGALVYVFMNYVVLPSAGIHRGNPPAFVLANAIGAIVLLVGLPIALVTARFSRKP